MERYSNSTREVAQLGRRGACLLSLDIRHPDVLDFINIKSDRSKVTGANISVKLTDDFMKSVKSDSDFLLKWPVESNPDIDITTLKYNENYTIGKSVVKRIKAKELFDNIVHHAWDNAEPGIFLWDQMKYYDPVAVYPYHEIESTNACSEEPMSPLDTCRLICINLFSVIKFPFSENAEIDESLLYKIAYEQCRLGDDLIDLEIKYVDRIISKIESDPEPLNEKQIEIDLWAGVKEKAIRGRRVGCGITGLGDMLAALNLKYDSDLALSTIDKVMRIKMQAELDCQYDLAILRGPFVDWDKNKEFIKDEQENIPYIGSTQFYNDLLTEFPDQCYKMWKYGRRNINWSTIAPTGTVSLMTQTTSGCEPLFMSFYIRRRKINPSDQNSRVDFTDQSGDKWQEYAVLHPKFKDWLYLQHKPLSIPRLGIQTSELDDPSTWETSMLEEAFKYSPWYKATANDINWNQRVKVQSILQKYTTSAISSTVNVPNDISPEIVANIYMSAWENNCKGITVYRDGCRTGVLISKTDPEFSYHDAVKRPKKLDCDIHVVSVKGTKYNVIVGMYKDNPYEIFAHLHDGNVSKGKGYITKESKGKYIYGSDRFEDVIVTNDMTDEQAAITRLVSTSLRHGVHIKFLCEQIEKTDGDLTSFTKAIARVLKKYIPDGEKSSNDCPECDSKDSMVFEEGCKHCLSCGYSACN